jgi:two-component system phosphate regulon sensor histidine kinase PhoR
MTGRIFLKLIVVVLALLLLALITVDLSAARVAKENYIQSMTQQLADKCRMLALQYPSAEGLDADRARKVAQAVGGRITVIRADGRVLVDTEADPARMENHSSREEVMDAFRMGTGSNIRQSATIGVSFLYVAVPVASGASVIRIAMPLAEINRQVAQIRRQILVSTSAAFLPAILIAGVLARFISTRLAAIMAHAGELARGNFRARLRHVDSSEVGELARTLNETAENLEKTVSQLQHEHAELEKLERVRKDFVINVSHELRTPLASIQGYTETLIDGALNDPDHNMRFLGIIRHNAERLARLTEDLLTLSRVEQKRQKFEFDYHSVNALIHDACELVGPMARKSYLQVVEEPAAENAVVYCDSEAVSQILSNLLDNAIKYTPAGGTVTVGAKEQGNMMEFFVRDTGAGIPEEELPRLFERFYRVDKARSRELGGTGLGLSIVKHLVAAHNGAARVESVIQKGSTFFFTLPADHEVLGQSTLNPEFTAS